MTLHLDPSLRPGARLFDRYLIERPLGAGGFATVWLALDQELERRVALKIMHPHLARSPHATERIAREASVLSALDHPGIARLLDFRADGSHVALAIAFVEGEPLDGVLGARAGEGRPFTSSEVSSIFGAAARAVSFAHQRGIIHRDIKPQNLMLGDALSLTVLDFGIARLLETDSFNATTHGRRLGSLSYGAPEQQAGLEIDARADVFALGCVLFELLTLRRAWLRGTDGGFIPAFDGTPDPVVNALPEVLDRMAHAERPRATSARPDLPPAIDGVIARALAADRTERHASVATLLEDVELALAVEPLELTVTEVSDTRVSPPVVHPRRRFALWHLAPGAAALATAGAIWSARVTRDERILSTPLSLEGPAVVTGAAPEAVPRGLEQKVEPSRGIAPPAPKRRTAHRPPPIAPQRSAHGPHRTLLEKIRERPEDLASIAALRDLIDRDAARIRDPSLRRRIRRIASVSAMSGDIAGFELAVEELAKASSRQ